MKIFLTSGTLISSFMALTLLLVVASQIGRIEQYFPVVISRKVRNEIRKGKKINSCDTHFNLLKDIVKSKI